MSRRLTLLAVLTVVALTATGCGNAGTGDKGYVSGSGIITVVPAADRKPPGKLSGETLQGQPWSLSSYAGKVVVVNVWGSWCPPCRAEANHLVKAYRELSPKGVVFIGINTRDASKDNGLAFERTYDVPYPSLYDPDGRNLLAFHGTIRPNAIPSTVVIDSEGRVAASILDEVTSANTLVDLVDEVSK